MTKTLIMHVGDRLPAFTAVVPDLATGVIGLNGFDPYLVIAAQDGDTVFGFPSPYVVPIPIDDATKVARYDWTQAEVDAALPGKYSVSVRMMDRAFMPAGDGFNYEVPSRADTMIIFKSRVVGYDYVVDGDGDLVLTAGGQPIPV